jgi:hypothetical protein
MLNHPLTQLSGQLEFSSPCGKTPQMREQILEVEPCPTETYAALSNDRRNTQVVAQQAACEADFDQATALLLATFPLH